MDNRDKKKNKKVIFICTHNSARSQMAEGILKHLYGDFYDVYSAGTHPASVNPYAIEVMKEIGIDISFHYSKNINDFNLKEFDIVITVCDSAKGLCPVLPGVNYIHKSFSDPSNIKGGDEEVLKEFRKVRDDIYKWIKEYFYIDKNRGIAKI